MNKLILSFFIPFTILMADFTLKGHEVTPLNKEEVVSSTAINNANSTPRTYTTANTSTTGTAKTNWGFQPFSVPSASVTVPAGGDIQAAINSLPNGGTVNLLEGNYIVSDLKLKSNMVIQGAGSNKTKLTTAAGDSTYAVFHHCGAGSKGVCIDNVVFRDFELDGNRKNSKNGGILFAWGAANLLFENLVIHDVFTNGITINNNRDALMGTHFTFRNLNTYNIGWQPISPRFCKGFVIDNVTAFNVGMAFDFSSVVYGEISNLNADLNKFTGYGTFAQSGGGAINGAKIQGSNYIYIHDSSIKNAIYIGIKLTQGKNDHGIQHLHMENLTVQDSARGILQIADVTRTRTFEEVVVKNVNLIDNYWNQNCWTSAWKPVAGCNNHQGILYPSIRVKGAINVHEYDDNIGITVASQSTLQNTYAHHGTTPEEDNVGWTTWGNP